MKAKKVLPQYSISETDRNYFASLCKDALLRRRTEGDFGFGTLAEKRMHAILKHYICPNEDFHEVGLNHTRYLSDVRIGNDIYEIQTGSFYPMRKKIAYYLENTDCTVTIVHPIAVRKWVSWVDPQTGEISEAKKSPKRESALDLLPELYCLLPSLNHPRLRFRLLYLEVREFRMLDGWSRDRKRGSNRYERIPLDLLGEETFCAPADFAALLPQDLPSPFTVKLFSKHTGLRGRRAYSAVHALQELGVISPTTPIGRAMAFLKQ